MEDCVNRSGVKIKQGYIAAAEMVIGTAMTALAIGRYVIPQGFAVAGVTGFSSVLIDVLPFSLAKMVLYVNAAFLLLGVLFEGKEFTLKTVGVSLLFPVMLQMFATDSPPHSALFSVLAGGVLLGAGTGLLLRSGASSGGFAVAAVILKDRLNIPVAVVLNVCDAAVILMQAMNSTLQQTVYGVLVITISAFVVGCMENVRAGHLHILGLRIGARC